MLIAKMEFSFYLSEVDATTKMHFNFEADSRTSKEGDWEAADPTSENLANIYFGEADGWWNVVPAKDDVGALIAMLDEELVTGIRSIWHLSFPHAIALVYDIPKLPF